VTAARVALAPRRGVPGLKAVRVGAFYGALLLGWKLIADAEVWPSYTLPGPGAVWDALRYNAEQGYLGDALAATMRRMAIGFGRPLWWGWSCVAMGSFPWFDETAGEPVLGCNRCPA
jgi:NitT/TauT family transport system permease protein